MELCELVNLCQKFANLLEKKEGKNYAIGYLAASLAIAIQFDMSEFKAAAQIKNIQDNIEKMSSSDNVVQQENVVESSTLYAL